MFLLSIIGRFIKNIFDKKHEKEENKGPDRRRNSASDEEEHESQLLKHELKDPEEEKEEDGPYQFYKAVFHILENSPLDDIKPSKNLPLLAPLKILNPGEADYTGIKIKLFKICCFGYGHPKNVKVELVDREITKQFDLITTSSSDKEEGIDV